MKEHLDLRFWHLSNHQFFNDISREDIQMLCVISGFRRAKKGELIYFAYEEKPRIFILKHGAVKIVSANRQGEEAIHSIVRKGDLFGQLTHDPNTSTEEYAVALTKEVIICSFFAAEFEDLMLRKPQLALKYTKVLGDSYKKIANSYHNLFFRPAKQRLLSFLVEWVAQEGVWRDGKWVLQNYLTQTDLAQVICTTRQTSASLLNRLEQDGLLTYTRKEIQLHDLPQLKKMCEM